MNILFCATGGMLSDVAASCFGMRGRLWNYWINQTLAGLFCLLMAYVDQSLGATVGIMLIFSIFAQQVCGGHVCGCVVCTCESMFVGRRLDVDVDLLYFMKPQSSSMLHMELLNSHIASYVLLQSSSQQTLH